MREWQYERMRIRETNYGLIVTDQEHPGAFAETEIFILGSAGQSGHCSLVVIVMAIGGGYSHVPEVVMHIPYGQIKYEFIPDHIVKALLKIRSGFVSKFLNDADIDQIVFTWKGVTSGE